MIASYTHHSPSSLNLFAAEPAMWVMEKIIGERQPGSAVMIRGRAVEAGVAKGLIQPEAKLTDCVDMALATYDSEMALETDPRREHCREPIGDMTEKAIRHLRPYGIPSGMQDYVERRDDELKLPVIGYSDFRWDQHGIIVDLKTTERMPSQIKVGHARQVAFYTGGNMTGHLVYVTPKKIEPYELANAKEHRASLLRIARTVEKWLALSDDPQYFIDMTVPDLESFYWATPPARELAYKYWRI